MKSAAVGGAAASNTDSPCFRYSANFAPSQSTAEVLNRSFCARIPASTAVTLRPTSNWLERRNHQHQLARWRYLEFQFHRTRRWRNSGLYQAPAICRHRLPMVAHLQRQSGYDKHRVQRSSGKRRLPLDPLIEDSELTTGLRLSGLLRDPVGSYLCAPRELLL